MTGVLLLALTVGLSGVGQSDTAGAVSVPSSLPTLPTAPDDPHDAPDDPDPLPDDPHHAPDDPDHDPDDPATLVAVAVSPSVADVAVGADVQFTATGLYSD